MKRALTHARGRPPWPASNAGRVLVGLILAGIALRFLASISWWPTTPTLEDGYQRFAQTNPFLDPQHPAGYGLIVAALGAVTRVIAFSVLVQHLTGVASALLLFSATRRITGSGWAGLLPAAIVLLGPDEILLEHAIMSESWVLLALSAGLYSAVRATEEPERWWRWPLLTGVALGAAGIIRTAAIPMIAIAALAILVRQPHPASRRRRQYRGALTTGAAAALILLAFASASALSGQRFAVAPSPGWYLYGRVAQFADCKRFSPPLGTGALCETRPASQRPSAYYYTFEPQAPGPRLFGGFGRDDGLIGAWARRALQAQPLDFLATAWAYLRSYWVPGSLPTRLRSTSTELDPQLDFTYGNVFYVAANHADLETYYDRFAVHTWRPGLKFLHDWQRVIRFGATALFVTTLLTLSGLALGSRQTRVGAWLFGVGGLSLLLAPALTGTYAGRYTVPMAGPMMCAAAITLTELSRKLASRRPSSGLGRPGNREVRPGI